MLHGLRWLRSQLQTLPKPNGSFRHLSYNPASAFAPASNDMLISLSMQHLDKDAQDQSALAELMRGNGYLSDQKAFDAFMRLDRAWFAGKHHHDGLYGDRGFRFQFGPDAATLSAPSIHCVAFDALMPRLGDGCRALDLACGSGLMTALMAETGASSTGVEIQKDLVGIAKEALAKAGLKDKADIIQADVFGVGMGTGMGMDICTETAFDAIYVGGAVEEVPKSWMSLLRHRGRMVVPVGPRHCEQELLLLEKIDQRDGDGDGPARVEKTVLKAACAFERLDRDAGCVQGQETQLNDAAARVDEAKTALQSWQSQFIKVHGYRPSVKHILADSAAAELLKQYQECKKALPR